MGRSQAPRGHPVAIDVALGLLVWAAMVTGIVVLLMKVAT